MTTQPSTPVTDWKLDQLDDLAGRTYLITGANSGVGYEAAVHLRRADADVLLAENSTYVWQVAALHPAGNLGGVAGWTGYLDELEREITKTVGMDVLDHDGDGGVRCGLRVGERDLDDGQPERGRGRDLHDHQRDLSERDREPCEHSVGGGTCGGDRPDGG